MSDILIEFFATIMAISVLSALSLLLIAVVINRVVGIYLNTQKKFKEFQKCQQNEE